MIGTRLNERYRVDAELGRGGMGVVYRAHDVLLDRDVALKVLSDSGLGALSAEGRARLLREAQAVAKLNHPNIVSVYDAGKVDGVPFVVMELVEGPSLHDRSPQALSEILVIACQICAALEQAHAHGIIHRDLKPENVLIAPDGSAKLVDFGLARTATASRLTVEGALVGTLFYIAPEQLLGQAIDGRADLYALGVMLYELTTGRLPFVGDDPLTVVSQHLHVQPVPPRQVQPDLPSALEAVILKLLAKNPADRYASAREVVTALTGTTEGDHPKPAASPRHNLPILLTSFIGRGREVSEVKRLLSSSRLVTLTGAGGCGKTRLALQAATDLLSEYPHGVWLVELAPLSDPALVLQTVAKALDVREESGRSYLEALTDYVQAKQLLLVLDNCEHVIEACARLVESVLCACPDLRILASSREALGITGEVAFRVPSLSLPDLHDLSAVDHLADYEAVRLFVERGTLALPSFAMTPDNALAVAQVCRRLDGIPLAIELAAAKVKVLRVEHIAARLDDCFRLLTGGSRTALPRQQTLRAAIDWSYGLLLDDERALLRRLAVFSSGWTLKAAEAVCGDSRDLDPSDVLDVLVRLVNKSMVIADRELGRETRYRLLETIRQYAREKLVESGESERMRRRHLEFFLHMAEQAEPELRGAHQAEWFGQLEAEHDNLRAALEWSLDSAPEAVLELATTLLWFWTGCNHYREGLEWTEAALARTEAAGRTLARAKALNAVTRLAFFLGDIEGGRASLEASLAIFRELEDTRGIAGSLNWLGLIEWQQGDYVAARSHFQESLALFRQLGDTWGIADSVHYLGHCALDQNDYASARACFEESLKLFRELGDSLSLIPLVKDLGLLAYLQDDFAAARPYYEESLELGRQTASKEGMAEPLNLLGDLARCQGDYQRAEALYHENLALLQDLGLRQVIPSTLHNLGYVALHQSDHRKAAALFAEGLGLFRERGDKKGVAECLAGLAGVVGAQDEARRAAVLFGAAAAAREALGVTLWPANRIDHDRNLATVRAQLDEAVFNAAWAEGRAMTLEQAIACALEETQ